MHRAAQLGHTEDERNTCLAFMAIPEAAMQSWGRKGNREHRNGAIEVVKTIAIGIEGNCEQCNVGMTGDEEQCDAKLRPINQWHNMAWRIDIVSVYWRIWERVTRSGEPRAPGCPTCSCFFGSAQAAAALSLRMVRASPVVRGVN